MTRPSLLAFKQKMVHRLTGKSAVSASQLARETGVRQQNLSRLAGEARSLPLMNDTSKRAVRQWMVEQKARVLAEASNLDGNEVTGVVIRQRSDLRTGKSGRQERGAYANVPSRSSTVHRSPARFVA